MVTIPMIHSKIGGMTGSVMKMEKVKAKELVTVPDSSVKNSWDKDEEVKIALLDFTQLEPSLQLLLL